MLTKPIDKQKLFFYIDKINSYYNTNKQLTVKISTYGQTISIDKNNIIFLESHERKVMYHTNSQKYEEYIKLDNAMNKLDNSFLRCHKSYAVNLKYVSDFSKSNILLINNKSIPVSRSHYDNVKKLIYEYNASKIGL